MLFGDQSIRIQATQQRAFHFANIWIKRMNVRILPKNALYLLLAASAMLAVLHTISLSLDYWRSNAVTEVLVEKFSLEGEANFPTYFSSMLLAISSITFAFIAIGVRQSEDSSSWRHWMGLCLIFQFLSLDEATQIHEKLDTEIIWASIETSGLLAWPWVIIYMGLVLTFGVFYFRFWLRLPRHFRIMYAACAAVYVGSALGFEMLEAREYTSNGGPNFAFVVLTSIEECCEMVAISFLVWTNLTYIASHFSDLRLAVGPRLEART